MNLKDKITNYINDIKEKHILTDNCFKGDKIYTVYQLNVADKNYIGITSKSLSERLDEHLFKCFSSNVKDRNACPKLFRKIRKTVNSVNEGRDKLIIFGIYCSRCELCTKIIEFELTMVQEKTYFNGLNSTPGGNYISGEFNWNYGKKLSEEHKRKISVANKGRIVTEEVKKKISVANTGRVLTDKNKKNMSIAHVGKISSNKGMSMSEDQKEKLRQINTGKNHTEETKVKMSNSHKKGDDHHNSKLTSENVIQIKKMICDGIKLKIIANEFKVDPSTISDIKREKIWRHIK